MAPSSRGASRTSSFGAGFSTPHRGIDCCQAVQTNGTTSPRPGFAMAADADTAISCRRVQRRRNPPGWAGLGLTGHAWVPRQTRPGPGRIGRRAMTPSLGAPVVPPTVRANTFPSGMTPWPLPHQTGRTSANDPPPDGRHLRRSRHWQQSGPTAWRPAACRMPRRPNPGSGKQQRDPA